MNALVVAAALSGAVAVIAGAFGSHGASGKAAEWLHIGAQYQMVHAVAALLAAQMGLRGPGWAMLGGAALFAGTLYLMAAGAPRWLGAITPIGGLAMIVGWLWLAWSALRGG